MLYFDGKNTGLTDAQTIRAEKRQRAIDHDRQAARNKKRNKSRIEKQSRKKNRS